MEHLDVTIARRLALVRAGLLMPEWTGLAGSARGRGARARAAALAVIRRFGYLQLDTVSIAGARSHAIVLHSRVPGLDARLGEELLRPGEPLFEYWGHEASWIPLELYPTFAFRRFRFRVHPWYGDVISANRQLARDIIRRIRRDGPIRSADLEGKDRGPWWGHRAAKKVVVALWSSGELAVRERRHFQRIYDLTERVIPADARRRRHGLPRALDTLILKALDGHGWAQTGTIAQTWRLRNMRQEIAAALERLQAADLIRPCTVTGWPGAKPAAKPRKSAPRLAGWIRSEDLELSDRLAALRPRRDRGVLLSPFDPVLWDRRRVAQLFDFDQVCEIFKPAPQRKYGYYCLPVLAGERLLARVDLKAERAAGELRILSLRHESTGAASPGTPAERRAVETAVGRYAEAVRLELRPP